MRAEAGPAVANAVHKQAAGRHGLRNGRGVICVDSHRVGAVVWTAAKYLVGDQRNDYGLSIRLLLYAGENRLLEALPPAFR